LVVLLEFEYDSNRLVLVDEVFGVEFDARAAKMVLSSCNVTK